MPHIGWSAAYSTSPLSLPPQASQSGHTIVVYEVALSVLRLVRHYASSLEDREWEVVFRILHSTQYHLTQAQQVQHHVEPTCRVEVTGYCLADSARLLPSWTATGHIAGHLL